MTMVSIELDTEDPIWLVSRSFYLKRSGDNDPSLFQVLAIQLEAGTTCIRSIKDKKHSVSNCLNEKAALNLEMANPLLTHSRAFVKRKRNLLLYEVTVSGILKHLDDKGKILEQKATTVFHFYKLMGQEEPTITNPKSQWVLPDNIFRADINISVKEINPFYLNNDEIANYLENYGEQVAAVLSGFLFKTED